MVARRIALCASLHCVAAAALVSVGAGHGSAAPPQALAYPSSQTIPAQGALPEGGATHVALNAAIGEHEGAWIVVRATGDLSVRMSGDSLAPLRVSLAWGHFVRDGGRDVPDALVPWDGTPRAPERPNQPVYVRVTVPRGTAPGTYSAALEVASGNGTATVPVDVRVYPFELPDVARGGRMLTSFHVSAPTYLSAVSRLYGFGSQAERSAAHAALYGFLADYLISPSSWGFGEPRTSSGYAAHSRWGLDSAANMREAAKHPFAAMRVPHLEQPDGAREPDRRSRPRAA